MESFPFVGPNIVQKHLKYSQLIPAVKRALQEYSTNRTAQPLRTAVSVEGNNGTLLTMPCYSTTDATLITKLVGLYPDNTKRNLPTHHCYVMLFDPDTGMLKCMMDGEVLTAMRTAAASVVATQTIAKKQPKILAVLGSGVQARSHIIAFCETFDIEKVSIWSRNFENAEKLCDLLKHFPVQNCRSVKESVCDADVIVTATNATEPVLLGKWLKSGCHINSVGACRPTWRECDDDCIKNSVLYTDSEISAENESGDIILSKSRVYAEIGEILLKQKEVKAGQRTFFKSLGIALEDAVAANLVWRGVQQSGELLKST